MQALPNKLQPVLPPAQASGDLKLERLQLLKDGKWIANKAAKVEAKVLVEPDGDDPQIGWRTLPQTSWCAERCWFFPSCMALLRRQCTHLPFMV